MLNLDQLIKTTQENCHISDAFHADNYSLCIFLLKMREYYRWENNIPFSEVLPRKDVGNWLAKRENEWQTISSETYSSLHVSNHDVDPFETQKINQKVLPLGYVYSGGYGLFNKPHFFLGKLVTKENIDGISILVSSQEYARDLVAPPAMTCNNTIFIRQDSLKRLLWQKYEEWKLNNKSTSPMSRAIHMLNSNISVDTLIEELAKHETQTILFHELGEIAVGKMLGNQWEDLLMSLSRSKNEFYMRAARDLLADCVSTIPMLIEEKYYINLHLYFANFNGIRKHVFPEAQTAYQKWVESDDLNPLISVFKHGIRKWTEKTKTIITNFQKDQNIDIEQLILQ